MGYNKLLSTINKFNGYSRSKNKAIVPYDKIPATEKWVEYSLDVLELKKALRSADIMSRFDIVKALGVAEGKVEYMYRHNNFDLKTATTEYKRAKRLLGLT